MARTREVTARAVSDLKEGIRGKIGERYLSLRAFGEVYGVSYQTAVNVFGGLKEAGWIALRGNGHVICGPGLGERERNNGERNGNLVGIHVRDISNHFYSSLCAALQRSAQAFNMQLVFMSSGNDNAEKRAVLGRFLELGCRGVVNFNSHHDDELAAFYRLYPLPFVCYGIDPIPGVEADFLLTDNRRSGWEAARHLAKAGAERYWYVTMDFVSDTKDERQNGFRQYLEETGAGGYSVVRFRYDENDPDDYAYVAERLHRESREQKLGIFCHHDGLAVTVLSLCAKKDIRVPADVCVVGYDNLPVARYVLPRITTFHYSYQTIADKCLTLLSKRLREGTLPSSLVVFPTSLIVRESTRSLSPSGQDL